jgi:hypothetical protein
VSKERFSLMMKTICSIFASPSAFEMAALCSLLASLASLLGRLQAVAENKAIEATTTAANTAKAARVGTQTLVGTNPAHQNHDSFRIVHSALRERSQRSVRWMQHRNESASFKRGSLES